MANEIDPLNGLTPRNGPLPQSLPFDQYEEVRPGPPTGLEPRIYAGDLIGERSRWDENLTVDDLENLELERALHQPAYAQAFNATVGGIAKGVMTSLEVMGYIADFENNYKRLRGLEYVEQNELSKLALSAKERIDEGMPIYRRDRKSTFDWSDPGFYWQMFQGILDSAVGFAIPGMAATKVVGGVQKAIGASKYLNFLKASKFGQQMTNAGLSAIITNYGEGKLMALEQYKNSMEDMENRLFQQNMEHFISKSDTEGLDYTFEEVEELARVKTKDDLETGKKAEEFNTLAGEEANTFIKRNRMFMLTDMIALHGIYRGGKSTRALLKEQGLKGLGRRFGTLSSDNLFVQGFKEGAEEIGQNMAQMEAGYQTLKGAGFDTGDTPEDTYGRMLEFATSDQALLEGLMGVFGGGPQRIFTEAVSGNFGAESRRQYRERFEQQQGQIAENQEFLNKNLGNFAQGEALRAQGLAQGIDNRGEVIKKKQYINVLGKNFALGTTGELESQLDDIINATDEQRKENGWGENSAEEAKQHKEMIKKYEPMYNRFSKYENQLEMFLNRMNRDNLLEDKEKIEELLSDINAKIDKAEKPDKADLDLRDSYDNMLKQVNEQIDIQDVKFNDMRKGSYQKEYKKMNDEIQKRAENLIEEENTKAKQDQAAKAASEEMDAADAKQAAANEEQFDDTGATVTEQERAAASNVEGEPEFTPDAQDDFDVSIFSTADEDFDTRHPDFAPDDIEVSSIPNDQRKKNAERKKNINDFKKNADDLSDMFESDPNPFAVKMTPEMERLGKFQAMLENLKIIKQSEDVTFSNLIMSLVEYLGTKRVRPMFGMLELLYSQQNRGYQVQGKSLDEYLELSRKEKLALEVRKNSRKRNSRPEYNVDIDKELQEYSDLLEGWVNDLNVDPTNDETLNPKSPYKKSRFGSSIIAYLSRLYNMATTPSNTLIREEVSDKLNPDLVSKAPLDPDRLLKGDKVTLRVLDDDNTDTYIYDGPVPTKVKWGNRKQAWKDDPLVDEDKYEQLLNENVPIGVFEGDELVAHLHETGWIKPENVYGNVEQDRERSRKIREHIRAKGEHTTTIKSSSIGYLFRPVDNGLVQTSKAFPDINLDIYIGSNGEYRNSRTRRTRNNLISRLFNKELPINGIAYIILPVSKKKQLAVPMRNIRIGENDNVHHTIMTAIKIFYDEKTDPVSNAFIEAVKTATKYDITTPVGISDFLQLFMHNKNIQGENDLRKYLSRPDSLESDRHYFMKSRRLGNDMNLEFSRGKLKGYVTLSKRSLSSPKTTASMKASFYRNVETMVANMFSHASLDHLGNNKMIPIINKKGEMITMDYKHYIKSMSKVPFISHNIAEPGQTPKYIYTIQRVIDLDFSSVLGVEEEIKKSKTQSPPEPAPPKSKKDAKTEKKETPTDNRPKRRRGFRLSDPDEEQGQGPIDAYARPMTDQERADFEANSQVRINPETREVTGVIIGDISLGKQEALVNYLKSEIVRLVLTTQKAVARDQIFDAVEADFKANRDDIAKEIEEGDTNPLLVNEHRMYDLYLKNWNEIKAITIDEISRTSGIKIKIKRPGQDSSTPSDEELADQILKGQSASEEELAEGEDDEFLNEEEQEAYNIKEGYSNVSHFTLDLADGIAAEVKQFLGGIEELERNEKGKFVPVLNVYLDTPQIVEYQELYELLQRITPSLRPGLKFIIEELEKHVVGYPTLRNVIDKITASSETLQNKFTDAMTNYYVDMRFIMVAPDGEGGFDLVEHESDINEHSRIIRHKWFRNLKVNGDIAIAAADSQSVYVINPLTKDSLASKFDTIVAKGEYTIDEIDDYLRTIGINLSQGTLEDIVGGKFKHNGIELPISQQFANPNGLFKIIHENIALRYEAVPIHHERLFNESVLDSLSKLEARYDIFHHTTSHHTGRKRVYSYSPTKFVINRIRELVGKGAFVNGVNPFIEELYTSAVGPSSSWLEQMREASGKNAMVENLSHWTVSLEPMKKKGSKPRNNTELHRIPDNEIEAYKIAMLQNQFNDRFGGGNRIIKVMYPTNSDKTGAFGLRILAELLELDENGNITEESINTVVQRVVVPEILRIKEFQEQKKLDAENDRHSIDNREYQEGSEQFLFFPQLNKVPEIFLGDQLHPNITGDEMMGVIRRKVGQYVNSLVEEKIQEWNEMGIVNENNTVLNKEFLEGTILDQANPLRHLKSREARVRGAATDMVFQYLVANAEISKVFTGDPAAYFTTADVNFDKNGNRIARFTVKGVNPEYDFIADAEQTYLNMGKRLAADIAPGSEIPMENGEENFYMQGFIADSKRISKNIVQLVKLLDGQAAYEKVNPQYEKFLNKEISFDEFYPSIKGLKSAPYFAIDMADAQEFTTWREHLWLMKQLGELTIPEYKEAYEVLKKGNNLSKKLLAKVLQPMKPVFVDNMIDPVSGFERRLYIKSSSFPLLPELTRDMDLDNLRLAMEGDPNSEEDKISRVAFSSAVKVGNVSNPIDIFDENGNIKAFDQINFDNSALKLNRKGFRIQQKVPHNAYKRSINKVSQSTKNFLVNMLGVKGFKTSWMNEVLGKDSASGAELQQIYNDIFGELHTIEKNELYNSIMEEGTPPNEINVNPQKLRDILIKEAKERSYPISDQELIAITDDLNAIGFSPSANKYESLLNSIVTNRIIKLKFPGKSFVLGTEAGFKKLTNREVQEKLQQKGIVLVDEHWSPEKGLLPAREGKNGERLPAQALIPWKYKNQKDKLIKLSQFTKRTEDGRTVLDLSKIRDREILEMFGMRIPNQGPNSQSWIEVVGFLPESSGDLLIATQDYVVQMGSDFDVDKLYAYMYNTYVDKDGNMRKHDVVQPEEGEELNIKDYKRALQNRIVDIHIAVHKNPDKRVQSQIAAPLVPWKLRTIANDVVTLRKRRALLEESDLPFAHEVTPTKTMRMDFDDQYSKILDGTKTQTTRELKQDYQEGEYITVASKNGGRSIAQITYVTKVDINEIRELPEDDPYFTLEGRDGDKGSFLLNTFYLTAPDKIDNVVKIGFKVLPTQKIFTGLSDSYQRMKFKNATAGKIGVSAFSIDSMFNATAQGKNLVYAPYEGGERQDVRIVFGRKVTNGNLSREFALDDVTFISDVIAGYQSASADNEKEQILDKININRHTLNTAKIMNQLGFTEEVPYFLAQDIIVDFVKELERASGIFSPFSKNRIEDARKAVLRKNQYSIPEGSRQDATQSSRLAGEEATIQNLQNYIAEGPKAKNYAAAQRALLDKFLMFDDMGIQLQRIQSAVNVDSSGVGKSLIESQLKEDQIYKLGGSPVRNAQYLIGDIRNMEYQDNPIDYYLNKGYFKRIVNGTTYVVKPNTVNGHSVVHGLFTNNDLWQPYFRYNDESIQSAIEKIEQMTVNNTDATVSVRAEQRYEIWKHLKAFAFTDDNLKLHTTTANQERERLVIDKYELMPPIDEQTGFELEGEPELRAVEAEESLARFLERFKNSAYHIDNPNPFVQSLESDMSINGDPSRIVFMGNTGDRKDQRQLYAAFTNMFRRGGKESVIIGTFQGKDYTLREFAQDLITYSYLTGGIQEAIQFIKYIPAAYLVSTPFISFLSNSHNLGYFQHNPMEKLSDELYNVPNYAEQYAQHMPEKIPTIETKGFTDVQIGDNTTEFRLNKKGVERFSVDTLEGESLPLPYLSVFTNAKNRGGYKVFKYIKADHMYVEIDKLGFFGVMEYNKNTNGKQKSIFDRNKADLDRTEENAPGLEVSGEEYFAEDENPEQSTTVTDILDQKEGRKPVDTSIDEIYGQEHATETFSDGRAKISSMLEQTAATSDDAYNMLLASELLPYVNKLHPKMDLYVGETALHPDFPGFYGFVTEGKYHHRLALNPDVIADINTDNVKSLVEKVFLHEVMHGFTAAKVRKWEYQNAKDKSSFPSYYASIDNDPNITLTAKESSAIKSLNTLYNQLVIKVTKDPELVELIRGVEQTNLTDEEKMSFHHSLGNLTEFVSGVFTSPITQRVLNSMDHPSGKSFWQVLLEKIRNLMKAITGMDVREGSVLEQAMYHSMELFTSTQEAQTQELKDQAAKATDENTVTRTFTSNNGRIYEFTVTNGVVVSGQYRGKRQTEWTPLKNPTVQFKKLSEQDQNAPVANEPLANEGNADNTLRLPSGAILTFSGEQYQAIKQIREWLKGDSQFFTLAGYAGTGKTTIVKKIIDEYRNQKGSGSVAVTAPTHNAAEIVGMTTGVKHSTLHSLLGLKGSVDLRNHDVNDVKFVPRRGKIPPIQKQDFIIIDEASMINTSLLNMLESLVKSSTKIIFMGDSAQIPPIGENLSEVFKRYGENSVELKETQRLSDGNPLGGVQDTIRNNLDKSNAGLTIRETNVNAKGDGIIYTNSDQEFLDSILKAFTSEGYKTDTNYAKVITWTNPNADILNTHIRKGLYGSNPNLVEEGELFTGARSIVGGKVNPVQNSRNYKVLNRNYITERADGIKGWQVTLRYQVAGGKPQTQDSFIVDTSDPATVEAFIREHDKIKADIISGGGAELDFTNLDLFRAHNITLENVGSGRNMIYKVMNYGYAGTVHKAQGGTYQHVFINETNIDQNRKLVERNRILYTSMTRPKHTATVLTSRPINKLNSHVDAEKNITTAIDEQAKANPLGKPASLSEQDGEVIDGYLGQRVPKDLDAYPERIISDEELDEFIKKCKS